MLNKIYNKLNKSRGLLVILMSLILCSCKTTSSINCETSEEVVLSDIWVNSSCFARIKEWNDSHPNDLIIPPTAMIDVCPLVSKSTSDNTVCPNPSICSLDLKYKPGSSEVTYEIDNNDTIQNIIYYFEDGTLPNFESMFLADNKDNNNLTTYEMCKEIFLYGAFNQGMRLIKTGDYNSNIKKWENHFDLVQKPDLIQKGMAKVFYDINSWTYCNSKKSEIYPEIMGEYKKKEKQIIFYNTICQANKIYGDSITFLEAIGRYWLISGHELGHAIDDATGNLKKGNINQKEQRASIYGIYITECQLLDLIVRQKEFSKIDKINLELCKDKLVNDSHCIDNIEKLEIFVDANACYEEALMKMYEKVRAERMLAKELPLKKSLFGNRDGNNYALEECGYNKNFK